MINSAGFEDWFRETAAGLDARVDAQDAGPRDDLGPRPDVAARPLQPLIERDLGDLGYFRFWPTMTTVAGVPATCCGPGSAGNTGTRS